MARQPPLLTVVIGTNGAGKSTWCRRNAEALPDPFFLGIIYMAKHFFGNPLKMAVQKPCNPLLLMLIY